MREGKSSSPDVVAATATMQKRRAVAAELSELVHLDTLEVALRGAGFAAVRPAARLAARVLGNVASLAQTVFI
jgi:hypothetical protein